MSHDRQLPHTHHVLANNAVQVMVLACVGSL